MSFRWTLFKWLNSPAQEPWVPLGKRMLHQTAKPNNNLSDLGQLDPGEEGVGRQLLHPEEKMNLGPFKSTNLAVVLHL
ncbi:uncharacterized protein LOC117245492 isoform X2 [Parus major]|uniref:uncharacterized protein LOC117245492 isoform X2 n=1 Tax=Parus major TaxID=9157 RepID=UPI001443BD1B|nr:uncharacterized protein LOC117245492 isoform X2 [Parus major]